MKRFLLLILVLLTVCSLSACEGILGIPSPEIPNHSTTEHPNDGSVPNTNGSQNGNTPSVPPSSGTHPSDQTIIVPKITMKGIYKTTPQQNNPKPVESFTDGESNYFFFKLGDVSRVPIAYSSTVLYSGIGSRIIKFSSSESVSNTISSAISTCYSTTLNTKISTQIGNGKPNENKASSASVMLSSELSAGVSASTSKTLTESVMKTFSQCSESVFELDPSCPSGFYRYTIYADCEIYLSIEAAPDTQTFEYTYLCFVKDSGKIEGWIYSEDGYFESADTIYQETEKLSVTEEMLESVDLYGNVDKVRKFKGATGIFSRSDINKESEIYYTLWNLDSNVYDIALIRRLFTKAKIEVSFDLESPSGDCQAYYTMKVNGNTLYKNGWIKVTEGTHHKSFKCEISLDDLFKGDNSIIMSFEMLRDGWWDAKKNSYNVKNGIIKVTFE